METIKITVVKQSPLFLYTGQVWYPIPIVIKKHFKYLYLWNVSQLPKYLDIRVFCNGNNVILHLDGQLTSWSKDQSFQLGNFVGNFKFGKRKFISDLKVKLHVIHHLHAAGLGANPIKFLTWNLANFD